MKNLYGIVLLFATHILFGQNPYYNVIDKSQGLLTNSVYDIFQDKDNYMWFATDKGLCRFNGYKFQYFSEDGMTSKSGSCIQQDAFGRIWYENFDGYLYYVKNNQLKKLNQNTSIGYFKYGIIKDQLYVVDENAINIYNLKSLNLVKSITLNTNNIKSIFFSDETIYLFTDKLTILKNDSIQQQIDFPTGFLENFSSLLVEKTKNGILMTSKFSNYYYVYANNQFIRKDLKNPNTFVQNLSWCDNKNWLCTTTGVIELKEGYEKNNVFFKGINISYIYKTKNNNFWISTLTDGLFYIEDFNTQLIDSKESLTSLCAQNEKIIIGTKNDKILTLGENQFQTIFSGKDNHQVVQFFNEKQKNQLFFTSSKFRILDANYKLNFESQLAVKNICAIDTKYVAYAASSSSGIMKINGTGESDWDVVYNTFTKKLNEKFNNIITNAKGKATAYDSIQKIIYFATNNGLFFINQKGLISELKHKNTSLNIAKLSFHNKVIYACSSDLNIYQIGKNISTIDFPKSINKESVEKIILKNELVFIITNKYIFEYDLSAKKLKQIIRITSTVEVNEIIFKNERYYIATNRGLILKKEGLYNRSNPVFTIENIKVNNKITAKSDLNELAYDENNLQINYHFLSATPFEEHDLLYRINKSPWQKADILNPKLVLNSLNYGNYTVEFALNSDFKNTTKINFTINRPFWLQFPFIIGATLVLLALIYGIYRNNIRKIKMQNQILLEKNELEKNLNESTLKAIKSQMNPHFFYNALNTIQSFILANDKKQAVNYLSKFSSLTRNILELTEKEQVTIADEIATLKLYLDIEQARFDEDFIYEIKTNDISNTDQIKIPAMLLQPYVENAVKHGLLHKSGQKILTISFEKLNNFLEISIDDNGVGRKKSAELNQIKNKNHQSFATKAMANRIELLNRNKQEKITITYIDKQNKSQQSLGTTVKITIPLD